MASPTEEAPVDAYCIDFCKSKLTVLGIDVNAAWKAKVRIFFGRASVVFEGAHPALLSGPSLIFFFLSRIGRLGGGRNRARVDACGHESAAQT